MNTALTIGVSDCSGGAGIQADLKVFTVLGVYGMAAVTAIFSRNTTGNRGMTVLDESIMLSQIQAIAEDLPVGAVKTAYLSTRMIGTVAEAIRSHALDRYVCDPVLELQGVAPDAAAVHAYRQELLPMASVVTPNRSEAALLANMEIEQLGTMAGAQKAAEKIMRTGCRAIVIKGMMTGEKVTDLFFDGQEFIEFHAKRLNTKNTYGAGSLFSAILTAMLAQEIELRTAVDHARSFVSQAIEHHVKIGGGVRPVNVLALTPQ